MPLNDRGGKRIFSILREAGPITSDDLGPRDDAAFYDELEEIERITNAELEFMGIKPDPFSIDINRLPKELAEEMRARLAEAMGTNELIARKGLGPSMIFRPYKVPGTDQWERSPAGQFLIALRELIGDNIDPRILAHTQVTQRFDPARGYFQAGKTPNARMLRHLKKTIDDQVSTNIAEGLPGKVFVLDVESPSLNPEHSIWQVAGQLLENWNVIEEQNHIFGNARMRLGEVGSNRQSIMDFIAPDRVEEDYIEGMRNLMRMANKADYLAGHSVFFDYQMLRHGLQNVEAPDEEFSQLRHTFLNKFYNEETGQVGNIIDTAQLARVFMNDLDTAPGLSTTARSLENILLQTNLVSRIESEIGRDRLIELLQGGTHFAHVDVPLEAYLLKYYQEGRQGGPGLIRQPLEDEELRNIFLGSRPYGPNIPLARLEEVSPKVRGILGDKVYDERGNIAVTPLENLAIGSRDFGISEREFTRNRVERESLLAIPRQAIDTFRNRRELGIKATASGIGRTLFRLGRLSTYTGKDELDDIALRAGVWKKISAGFTHGHLLNLEGDIPTAEEWAKTQAHLAEQGIPFAGMSWVERHLSAVLGQVGGYANPLERQKRLTFGADITPMGRFKETERLKVVQANVTTVPLDYLEEWERSLGDSATTAFTQFTEKPQFLYMSPFRWGPNKENTEVSLMAKLEGDEKESFLEYLRSREELNGTELYDRVAESIRSTSGTYGLQVGTLTKFEGGLGVNDLYESIKDIAGEGADFSDQTARIALPYAGRGEGGSVLTSGVVINPTGITEDQASSLAKTVGRTRQLYEDLGDEVTGINVSLMETIASGDKLGIGLNKAYSAVREFSPAIAVAAAVTGYGYYRHEKKRREAQTDVVMKLQPAQEQNPLRTAGLVQQLDSQKIQHTAMGNQKYNFLFGAGYQ